MVVLTIGLSDTKQRKGRKQKGGSKREEAKGKTQNAKVRRREAKGALPGVFI
jgi:hypothetical protein